MGRRHLTPETRFRNALDDLAGVFARPCIAAVFLHHDSVESILALDNDIAATAAMSKRERHTTTTITTTAAAAAAAARAPWMLPAADLALFTLFAGVVMYVGHDRLCGLVMRCGCRFPWMAGLVSTTHFLHATTGIVTT
jgi:hypothetical protein